MGDLFNNTQGIAPTIQEDFEPVDFSIPVSCGAKAKILDAGRNAGTSERTGNSFDVMYIECQVTEVLDAKDEKEKNAAKNRFLGKVSYWMTDSDFSTAKDNLLKLKDDLATIGSPLVEPSQPMEDEDYLQYIASHLMGLKDKIVDVRCWPGKKKEDGSRQQKFKLVSRDVTAKKGKENVPF